MKLEEMMTHNPFLLKPEQKIREVLEIFFENKIDGAPVVDDNQKLIGIFTKTHVYRIILNNMDMNTPISSVMTREHLLTGHPDDEFDNAVTPKIPRLPVVDDTDTVIGILTRGDIANAFFDSYHNISKQLDTIINSTHNMIVSVDEQGEIKVFNQAAEKTLKMKAEDVINKDITQLVPTSRLKNIIETGKQELMQKITINGKHFISNRSPIIKDGKIIGAVAVLQDISDIEKVSKELESVKQLNKEFDVIFNSSFDGIYICDAQGKTLRFNKAIEALTGITGNALKGRNMSDLEKEGVCSQSATLEVMKAKGPVTVLQTSKHGKITLATGTPVYNDEGDIFRIITNVRDITELEILKQELEQAKILTKHYQNKLHNLKFIESNNIIINSPNMQKLMELVSKLAQTEVTVLLNGESGTGKELIADYIHQNSVRKIQPFIKVNCGAFPENLLESELFGYEPGAFTGADKEGKQGYFELASGGILFLDEIGELPLNLQVKLLRVLQNMEISKLGGVQPIKVDVRIIAATNRNLAEMVKYKKFREDLYYRLNVVPVFIPPLRDRKEDIVKLVAHFMHKFNKKHKLAKRISPRVIDIFMKYEWPGNIRELENLIERLIIITSKDTITKEDIPSDFHDIISSNSPQVIVSDIIPLKDAVESVEKQILEKAFSKYKSTRYIASKLKVTPSTILRKSEKYGLSR